jgi:hypothetical protein
MRGRRRPRKSVQRFVGVILDWGNAVQGDAGCQRSISRMMTARQTLPSHVKCATRLSKTCHVETVPLRMPGTVEAQPTYKSASGTCGQARTIEHQQSDVRRIANAFLHPQ